MKNKQILPLLIACGLFSSASAANLVVNGGFEKVDDKGTVGWRPDGTVWSLGETAGVDESRRLAQRPDNPIWTPADRPFAIDLLKTAIHDQIGGEHRGNQPTRDQQRQNLLVLHTLTGRVSMCP